jgi:hypothetical protein
MLISDRFSCATALRDTSARKPKITAARCIEYFSSILVPLDFCDTRFSSLAAVSALVKRFMAAMINTSFSVKPRVVIFHMTVSQLVRSIAPLCKARAVPNAVAHVSDGKALGLAEVD